MYMRQLENYVEARSSAKVQNSVKLIYAKHLAGEISRGDSVLTLNEAAEILRLSRDTVKKLIREKRLKGVRTGGYSGKWRISQSAIEEFLRGE